MRTSESVAEIGPAMVAAFNEMTTVSKDSDGHYGRYVTLGAVLAFAKPILASHGLAVQQYPTVSDPGSVQIVTRMWHTTGEWVEDEGLRMPAPNDPQKVGGAVSYARRYSLIAFLGLAADDDDGQSASEQIKRESEPHPLSERVAAAVAEMKALDDLGKQDLKEYAAGRGFSLAGGRLLENEQALSDVEFWLAERNDPT